MLRMAMQTPQTLEFQTEAAALRWARRFPGWDVRLEFRGPPDPQHVERVWVAERWRV